MNNHQPNSYSSERIIENAESNAFEGEIRWSPSKIIWITTMFSIAIIGGILTYSLEALLVFLLSTGMTLCLGHSIGMHRKLIHQSFQCPKWLEYFLVHLGVLIGLAGPKGIMATHDLRDWAQRQTQCHDYFAHRQPILHDGIWQILCEIQLQRPPKFQPEAEFANDRIYHWMEKNWMWQQLPWAILFLGLGGISWLVWGICMRVMVSIVGHWLIGYFAHNHGARDWHVQGASVQGYNIKFTGLITMGECWHNNHHAFPGSAKLGIEKNQMDPGWWVLSIFDKLGLIWDIKLPKDLPVRDELQYIDNQCDLKIDTLSRKF